MTGIRILLLGLIVSLVVTGCASKKRAKRVKKHPNVTKPVTKQVSKETKKETKSVAIINPSAVKDITTLEYIDKYSEIAIHQMRAFKIPASITLAQGILESRSGNSDLTKISNNHFGIKCHKGWKGARTYFDDDKKGECFRVYEYASNSFNDHSRFLVERKRYSDLFKLNQSDYKAWAKGLQKAGYATDKRYPQKLISIIERYELYKFDQVVLGKKTSKIVTSSTSTSKGANTTTNPLIYIVEKGDGLYSISRKFNIEIDELKRINNLDSNAIHTGQQLYLQSVDDQTKQVEPVVKTVENNKTVNNQVIEEIGKTKMDTIPPSVKKQVTNPLINNQKPIYHIVQEGETLYQIAYKYDLSIPEFRQWNGIVKDRIKVGQRLLIQKPLKKPLSSTKKKTTSIKKYVPGANTNTHTVSRGETLYSISKKYRISVPELRALNNLNDNTIRVGQVLVIKQ